jgi:hypothetical protein
MRIEVIREYKDGLSRQVYTFWYFDDRHALVLDTYVYQERVGRKWKTAAFGYYSRLNERESSIAEAGVPLPDDVRIEAAKQFMSKLKVTLWSKAKGGQS